MNNGSYNFNSFMQAAYQSDPNIFHPQPPGAASASPLSPYAPMFTPNCPPSPDFAPPQGTTGQFSSRSPQHMPLDFSRPPPMLPMFGDNVHHPSQSSHAPANFQPQQMQQREHPGPPNEGYFRGRGRGSGRFRGRGNLNHAPPNGGYPTPQVPPHSGRGLARNQQYRLKERNSRNDYGDLLYSHAEFGQERHNPKSGNPSQGEPGGNNNPGNMYVRKVDQYYNRRRNFNEPDSFRSTHGKESVSSEGRGGNRGPAEAEGKVVFSSKNKNSVRSAPPGRNKPAGPRSDSPVEGGDRRVRMEEQLKRGCYECMVCYDNIRQEVAVWNCQTCYHLFHLRCIKEWVRSSLTDGEVILWRCPACQNANTKRPNGYRCFCGKVKEPRFQPGETPHSCGEVCGRKGKDGCMHKCVLLCHPGPCPPCSAVVQRSCNCGAERKSMRCDQVAVFKCEKVCGKSLNCGLHQCQEVCHAGDCPACQVTVKQECYGGHKIREVLCGSNEASEVSFSCQQPCHKTLACNNHVCEEGCHPGECGVCCLLPQQVTRCACGQTPLSQLSAAAPRTSCLDPVPVCHLTCSKPLPCGPPENRHVCQSQCHEGPCKQCEGVTTVTCVCGANSKEFACQELAQFTAEEPFKCERRCNKKRMCGRHKCNELCCTRDVHICELVCGRPLSCGLHKCEDLCHRGNCRPCLQASFEELTCRCGAEVLFPPVPCGTKPPPCHRICTRRHNCDHPVRHTCHSEESCPPCAELTQKACMGDHEKRKNVPCYMPEISCGRQCLKPLSCGQHKCIKSCHRGPCLPEDEKCAQPCPKKRKDCDHPCAAPCHADVDVCPVTTCRAQVEIKCACGHRSLKTQCQGGSNVSAEIAQFQRLTVQAMASGASGQDVDISQLTVQKKNANRQLECDANCALLERNKRLAQALDIQNPDFDAKAGGAKYSDFLKDTVKKFPQFVAKVEKNLADLVQSAKQSKQPSRSFAFPSMNRDQRRTVHELAEAYGCQTQSYDYEPNKNVVATAYKNKSSLPALTLSASLARMKSAPPPIPHHAQPVAAWGSDKMATSLFKDKDKEKRKDKSADIDYFDFSSG